MKKLITWLIISAAIFISTYSAFAQTGSQAVSGIKYRVNDTTTYQTAVTTAHAQGYADIYFNNQATRPHWDIWSDELGAYQHVFDFNAGVSAQTTMNNLSPVYKVNNFTLVPSDTSKMLIFQDNVSTITLGDFSAIAAGRGLQFAYHNDQDTEITIDPDGQPYLFELTIADSSFGYIYFANDTFRISRAGSTAGGSYTDEQAQDAVGGIVDATLVYNDATPSIGRAALTGDVTASAGSNTTAIATGAVVDADINASAAIDATKIADGSVTSTEFQYIGGLTSDAQTQLTSRWSTAGNSLSGTGTLGSTSAQAFNLVTNNITRATFGATGKITWSNTYVGSGAADGGIDFSNSYSHATISGNSYGTRFLNTVTASAASQLLVGILMRPTLVTNGQSGITKTLLRLEDESGNPLYDFRQGSAAIAFGSATLPAIVSIGLNGTNSSSSNAVGLIYTAGFNASNAIAHRFAPIGGSITSLNALNKFVQAVGTYTFSSGTTNNVHLALEPTLNFTSTYTGDFYGALYNPTRTSVTGLREFGIVSTAQLNGFGTSITPHSSLHSGGSFAAAYSAHTTTYAITATDYFVNCTSGSFTVTLPTAVSCSGRMYVIKNSGAGTITIATTSSQTIDGAAPGTVAAGATLKLISDGSNWFTWI